LAKARCISLSLLLVLVACGGQRTSLNKSGSIPTGDAIPKENWPEFVPDPSWHVAVAQERATYAENRYSYEDNLQDYTASGDYLNWGLTERGGFGDVPGVMKLDETGVPMVMYDGEYYYNPVTISQFSLSEYGMFLRGSEPDLSKFWAGVNKLLELQREDGSFPYVFDFPYYLNTNYFRAPWTSGMAQGQALSVLARAWHLRRDPRYIAAGNKAFDFLSKTVSNGGDTDDLSSLDPSLSSEIIIEEYPAEPPGFTLNGFMFAMLGVYDWAQVDANLAKRNAASFYFSEYVQTLDHILPYYDLGGFSAYDLGHITYHREPLLYAYYHAIHIYELHALYSITNDPVLKKYEMLWRSDVSK